MFYVHFIHKNRVIDRPAIDNIPRIGEEVRYGEKFYRVIKIVWCMDETRYDHQGIRVNIGLKKITGK
jgi:hypothetical protein